MLAARILAGLAALAILLFAAWGALFILWVGAYSARAPDPFAPSGDPCCGHPATWAEVAAGLAWTIGLVLLEALLVCAAIVLLCWAAKRRRPRLQRLALLPAGAVAAGILVLTAAVVPLLDEGVTPPDCDSFEFDRAAWRSDRSDARNAAAYGVAHCGLVAGRTPSQVRRLLGSPSTHDRANARRIYWDYGGLVVWFADGVVVETHAGA